MHSRMKISRHDVAFYLRKSRTVTTSLIKRHEQVSIGDVIYIFEYAT